MRAAALHTNPLSVRRQRKLASRNGHEPRRFVASPEFARLDSGDFRAIVLSFGFAAGLVLALALACDMHLVVLSLTPVAGPEDGPSKQLAADLLPWAAAFTAVASAGAALALWAARTRSSSSAQTDAGFRQQR